MTTARTEIASLAAAARQRLNVLARISARVHATQRAVAQAPRTLRGLVRGDEIFLVLLAAILGAVVGLVVVAMNVSTQLCREFFFHLPHGQRLSAQAAITPWSALVPALGGILVGLTTLAAARFALRRVVDPIEANALYGGQMSLNASLFVVAQTMLSNGFGASVGLEAGFAQIGAAIASRTGRSFRVRRADLRVLVGCGAAGAIAAAFNAPLTGAFYAYELVIGTYTLGTLAPVVAAAITAVSVQRLLLGDEPGFDVPLVPTMETAAFLPLIALGVIAALAGIAIMRAVTVTEELFRRSARAGLAAPRASAAWRLAAWRCWRPACLPAATAPCARA